MIYDRPIIDERYQALRKRAIRDLATARYVPGGRKDDERLIEFAAAELWLTDALMAASVSERATAEVVFAFGQTSFATSDPWKRAAQLLAESEPPIPVLAQEVS